MSRAEAEKLNEMGIEYLQNGKAQEAMEAFAKAIEEDETYSLPYSHIGNLLAATDRHEEAINWFHKAIQLDDSMAIAYYGLGSSLFSLEKWAEAIHMFKEAQRRGLDHGDLYFMLGMSHLSKGEGNEAIALAYFQTAIEKNPEDIEALFQRGLCSAYLGHLEQAKRDFLAVTQKDETHSDAFFNLGIAYSYEENAEKALEYLDKAVEIQPNHILALHARKQIRGQ